MATLEESVNKTRSWPGWAGSTTDLQRLLRLIEAPFESLIDGHVEEQTKYKRSQLTNLQTYRDTLESRYSYEPNSNAVKNEAERLDAEMEAAKIELSEAEAKARAENVITMTYTAAKGDIRTTKGNAADLASWMDSRPFLTLEFTAPLGYYLNRSISLSFDRNTGVTLRVSARDAQWAIASFAELESEIQRQYPRTSFIRNWWVLAVLFGMPAFILFNVVINAMPKWIEPGEKLTGLPLILFVLGVMALLLGSTSVLPYLAQKWIPAVDIAPAGQAPKPNPILRLAVTLASAIIVGVVVNLIV